MGVVSDNICAHRAFDSMVDAFADSDLTASVDTECVMRLPSQNSDQETAFVRPLINQRDQIDVEDRLTEHSWDFHY